MVKIGKIEKLNNGAWKIEREWYGQGSVFKDEEAYRNRPDEPCYVPELSDTVYTANDILALCNGQKDFADELFEGLDWSHPESLMEDWMVNDEWVRCSHCGKLVNYGAGCNNTVCPFCGKVIGDEPEKGEIKWFSVIATVLEAFKGKDADEKTIWSDGNEILCPTEEYANAVADLIECLYRAEGKEVDAIIGFYDPKDDNGEADDHTGWWYVTLE